MSTTPALSRSMLARKANHVLIVVFVFALLGPPAAWFVWVIPSMMMRPLTGSLYDWFVGLLLTFVVGMPVAYIFGILQAALTGLIVGIGQVLLRRFGLIHAAAIGLAAGLLFAWNPNFLFATTESVRSPTRSHTSLRPNFQDPNWMWLVQFGFVPTLLCWFVVRRRSLVD